MKSKKLLFKLIPLIMVFSIPGNTFAMDLTPQLEKNEHFHYINGYPEGDVRPQNNITREEVATIFYRLLKDDSRDKFFTTEENFHDIDSNRWSSKAIATLAKADILTGYPNKTFDPTKPISRAEFAVIVSKFDYVSLSTEDLFSDIANHWAKEQINSASMKGWINGYPDGTFKPDQLMTRAEAMALINRALERKVDAQGLINDAKHWTDNSSTSWYYYEVLEATNDHDYQKTADKDSEKWTTIKLNKVWNE